VPRGTAWVEDARNLARVTAVNDGTNDRVADTYKGWLLEKRTYASGAYLTHLDDNSSNLSGYGYDTFGRIKNHRWKSSGGTLLAGWAQDYNRLANKKYQEDLQAATRSELYGYDAVYRVTSFKRGQLNEQKTDITSPTRTQTWTLDDLGNWSDTTIDATTETRTHNDVNELTQQTVGGNSTDLTYDDAGSLIQDGPADGSHQYVWDYRNRLIEAKEKQSGNWNTVGAYKYDAQGRRIRKVVTNKGGLNGTTRFIWGGDSDWQCLEERNADDNLVARFTYSPDYIDAVAVQERDLNADSDFGDTNEVVYYHQNALFNVYALSDSSGSVIERYRYDAYGGVTVLDADGSVDADGLSDAQNPYLFTGRRLDPETGLMQYRHRYYSPTLGRFDSRHPAGYQEAYDLYAYVTARPTNAGDPLGLAAKKKKEPTPINISTYVADESRPDGNFIRDVAGYVVRKGKKPAMKVSSGQELLE
jgi:RHS repeat-associated protein